MAFKGYADPVRFDPKQSRAGRSNLVTHTLACDICKLSWKTHKTWLLRQLLPYTVNTGFIFRNSEVSEGLCVNDKAAEITFLLKLQISWFIKHLSFVNF